MKNLIIIGVGSFAREIYKSAQNAVGFGSDWTIKGFLDGDVKLSAEAYQKLPSDVPVLGDIDSYETEADDVFTCAINAVNVRKKLIEKILPRGANFINIIDRKSQILPSAKLGRGVLIGPESYVSDYVEIGDFSTANNHVLLGHDVRVGRFTVINMRATVSGNTIIGDEVFIGVSVSIAPKSRIGSVVIGEVPAGANFLGNPARNFNF